MTPRIEQLGGLTEGAIRALVLKNNEELDQRWGDRMEKLSERIEERIDRHEDKVEQRFQVTEAKIDSTLAKVGELVHLVKGHTEKQDGWRDDDLVYRAGIQEWRETQEPKIEAIKTTAEKAVEDVKEIRHRLKLIAIFFTMGKALRGAALVATESKGVLIGIAALCSALSAIWLFFHSFIPWLEKAWRH